MVKELDKLIEKEINKMAFEYSNIQKKDIIKLCNLVLCNVLDIQKKDIEKVIKELSDN